LKLTLWKRKSFDSKKNFRKIKKVEKNARFVRKNQKKPFQNPTFFRDLPRFSEKLSCAVSIARTLVRAQLTYEPTLGTE